LCLGQVDLTGWGGFLGSIRAMLSDNDNELCLSMVFRKNRCRQ